jgi:hypothetical protein
MRNRSSGCRPTGHRSAAAWAGSAAFLLGPPAALADDAPNMLEDPFYAALGTYVLNSDTKVRLDGESGRGTDVDWENTFGDDGDMTRGRIDGFWRFADRHKLRFLWFNASRTSSNTTEEDIEWGDEVYPVDTKVKAESSFDIYELAYEYAFLRRENYEVTGTFGLHYTDLGFSLSAKASSSGGTLDEDIKEDASVAAPLPAIGLRGLWALPYNLWIDASAQWFALSIDEYDGSLADYRLTVTWQPKAWLGIGLGYNQFDVDVDVEKDRFDGSLDWTYRGPMLFYSVVF